MFQIVGGKIEFHPGWKAQGETSIKAPNLKQAHKVERYINQEIMDNLHVPTEVQKDLKDMMNVIGSFPSKIPEEEA